MEAKMVVVAALAVVGLGFLGFIYFTSSMTNIPMFSPGMGKDEL